MRVLAHPRPRADVAPAPTPSEARSSPDRKRFWAAYLQWLSVATTDELEQLASLLAGHSQQVRSLSEVITGLLAHRPDALPDVPRVPPTLLATFVSHGWRPDVPPGSRRRPSTRTGSPS